MLNTTVFSGRGSLFQLVSHTLFYTPWSDDNLLCFAGEKDQDSGAVSVAASAVTVVLSAAFCPLFSLP